MENISTNIKAVAIAAIILLFTYWYYTRKDGNFIAFEAVVVFGLLCLCALVVGTLLIRLLAYCMHTTVIYPHLFFRILLPFLVMSFIFWLVYGIVCIPRFTHFADFMAPIKYFTGKHLLYCIICATIAGVVLSLPLQDQNISKNALFYGNVKFAMGIVGAFALSTCIFYWTKKIDEAPLDPKYNSYQALNSYAGTSTVEVKPLLNASEYNLISVPYLLSDKQEVILNFLYNSSNKKQPLLKSLRLDKSGKVIDSLDTDRLLPQNEAVFFDNGYIRSRTSPSFVTWVFDGLKTIQNATSFTTNTNLKIQALVQDTTSLKMVRFQKTAAFSCESLPDIKWNGSRFYELIHQNDTLKFKIDQVYTATNNGKECSEQTLAYFKCNGMDFDLIRLNEREYYIVQPRKK